MELKQTLYSASVLFLCICVKWVQPYAQHEMCTLLSPCANVTFACISTMLCTGGGNWSASTWAPDSTSLWCHLLADVCHLCTPAQPYTCHMIVNSIGLPMCFMSVTQVCMRNPVRDPAPEWCSQNHITACFSICQILWYFPLSEGKDIQICTNSDSSLLTRLAQSEWKTKGFCNCDLLLGDL